jgi:hypothetical protein
MKAIVFSAPLLRPANHIQSAQHSLINRGDGPSPGKIDISDPAGKIGRSLPALVKAPRYFLFFASSKPTDPRFLFSARTRS